MVQKFEDLGGTLCCNSEVKRILITDPKGGEASRYGRRVARGVELADGNVMEADIVVSNGDYAWTYMNLIDPKYRLFNSDSRLKRTRQSMSLVVIYFGFRAGDEPLDLRHHNIILGPRYEGLLQDIFDRKVLSADFSQYLHIPTLTDPSLAPAGHHAAYTLIPVPNKSGAGATLDWSKEGPKLVDTVLRFLDERGYIPGLCDRIVYKSFITPDYFEKGLNSFVGNAFGPEPVLTQSAFFRPHNKSEDIENLYIVGAGAQPGGGTPSVMMSAKMTARIIAEDFKLS
jgi:phytoene desaturase